MVTLAAMILIPSVQPTTASAARHYWALAGATHGLCSAVGANTILIPLLAILLLLVPCCSVCRTGVCLHAMFAAGAAVWGRYADLQHGV